MELTEAFNAVYQYFSGNPIELLGALTGILCVYLNAKENIWGWPIGIVSVACYVIVFWNAFLFGDFLLHIIYVILGFYGWYYWLYGGKKKDALPISVSPKKELLFFGALGSILILPIGWLLSLYPNASVPYWDATTTIFSLLAQWQLARKRLENWLTWLFVDTLCVVIYYYKELYITSGLYFVYLILATLGYLEWRRHMNKRTAAKYSQA